MRIVHVAAEFAPIAKAGGLGEVLLGLTRELTKKGLDVETILPKYDFLDLSKVQNLSIEVPHFKCLEHQNAMWSCKYEECQLHLLEARHPAGYFHRGKIYGCEDDAARFIYFSRAVLEYLALQNKPIDVLHLHDWHVALCAPMVRNLFHSLKVKSIILTIHNVEYQGKCAVADLNQIGLNGSFYLTPNLLQDDHPKHPSTINLLKGGLIFSDALVAVSPTYAQEILTPEYGGGLDGTLRKLRSKIVGILNGIDEKSWDPETDPFLPKTYGVESALKGKQRMREVLKLGKRPLIGAITRLVAQKGPELLEEAIEITLKLGGSYILLGSAPHAKLQQHFDQLKKKYQGNPQVLLEFEYHEALSHQLYAALDFLLVPSHYEPCGLTQMIAMRYGTVPIVRATGGLQDTVFDVDDASTIAQKRNGFVFRDKTKESMQHAIARAVRLFVSDPATFQSLIRRGMQSDFSWKRPAAEYIKLYRSKSALDINPIRINVIADRDQRIQSGQ
ncbi:MAG: glycogen synthase [Verrucomicrobia bacterium]|nr:glycogen synthase [Verrucomicrobiota bacterium]MBU6445947.1 glycogen synthase [Verrucomicrobiota bacterium]MDE3046995.1 glycogen synthase [Verrucomicrobiota bacterium]